MSLFAFVLRFFSFEHILIVSEVLRLPFSVRLVYYFQFYFIVIGLASPVNSFRSINFIIVLLFLEFSFLFSFLFIYCFVFLFFFSPFLFMFDLVSLPFVDVIRRRIKWHPIVIAFARRCV